MLSTLSILFCAIWTIHTIYTVYIYQNSYYLLVGGIDSRTWELRILDAVVASGQVQSAVT